MSQSIDGTADPASLNYKAPQVFASNGQYNDGQWWVIAVRRLILSENSGCNQGVQAFEVSSASYHRFITPGAPDIFIVIQHLQPEIPGRITMLAVSIQVGRFDPVVCDISVRLLWSVSQDSLECPCLPLRMASHNYLNGYLNGECHFLCLQLKMLDSYFLAYSATSHIDLVVSILHKIYSVHGILNHIKIQSFC